MFENFSRFFANKKNLYIFIAALVILTGIFLLKRAGLYEGAQNQGDSDATAGATAVEPPKKNPSSIKATPIS
jgi:hypothetical protein